MESHSRSIEIGKKIGRIIYDRIGYYAELKQEYINRPCQEVIYELALANAIST